jgi:3',5'-cyclic AMP phosphodiesterase CpdA
MPSPASFLPNFARYEKKLLEKSRRYLKKRLVILSDTHISDGSNNQFNPMMFRKGIEEINRIKNVDFYLHLGDVTSEGTYLDYQYAQDSLHSMLSKPNFYCIPGNHDARNVGYLLFQELIAPRLFEVEDSQIYMVGLDSTIPDQDGGHIGEMHIEKFRKRFMDHQDQTKIFGFHHQLFPIPFTGRERSTVIDAGDVMDMALQADVDIILNGHRHISNIYTITDGNAELSIFNAGTLSCNKTRYRELFSFTVLDLEDNIATFRTRTLLDDQESIRERYVNQKFTNEPPMTEYPVAVVVHIGNTHFAEDHFERATFEIIANQIAQLSPNAVIHTGSLTYNNNPEDYLMAREYLKKFMAPVIVLPGHRDIGKFGLNNFIQGMADFKNHLETPLVNIFALNALDIHFADGKVGRTKMQEVLDTFARENSPCFNILALNHRIVPPPHLRFDEILTDAGDVLADFTHPDHHIDVIFQGKSNIPYAVQFGDTVITTCGALCSHDTYTANCHSFNSVWLYESGFVEIKEHIVETAKVYSIGRFWIKTKKKTAD